MYRLRLESRQRQFPNTDQVPVMVAEYPLIAALGSQPEGSQEAAGANVPPFLPDDFGKNPEGSQVAPGEDGFKLSPDMQKWVDDDMPLLDDDR